VRSTAAAVGTRNGARRDPARAAGTSPGFRASARPGIEILLGR
jgi:hypothetical protein